MDARPAEETMAEECYAEETEEPLSDGRGGTDVSPQWPNMTPGFAFLVIFLKP